MITNRGCGCPYLICAKAQGKRECAHSHLPPPANVRHFKTLKASEILNFGARKVSEGRKILPGPKIVNFSWNNDLARCVGEEKTSNKYQIY